MRYNLIKYEIKKYGKNLSCLKITLLKNRFLNRRLHFYDFLSNKWDPTYRWNFDSVIKDFIK